MYIIWYHPAIIVLSIVAMILIAGIYITFFKNDE